MNLPFPILYVSVMDVARYVSWRMFSDICGLPMRESAEHEQVFQELFSWMSHYTRHFNGRLFLRLPPIRDDLHDLIEDLRIIYRTVFNHYDVQDELLIRSLFITTYYLMIKYMQYPLMCANISFYFEAITYDFNGWDEIVETDIFELIF